MISEKETINKISFETRDKYLLSQSTLVIAIKNKVKSKVLKELLNQIGEIV